jgi:RNA polymerase-binding transcription factor DksA
MSVDSVRPAGALAVPRPADPADPHWRVLLESRWRARLLEVTELSLAYHDAAAAPVLGAGPDGSAQAGGRQLRRLLNQAVAARRALADTEEALVRLAAGRFGRCEHCAALIPPTQLAIKPEARYCPRCAPAGRL